MASKYDGELQLALEKEKHKKVCDLSGQRFDVIDVLLSLLSFTGFTGVFQSLSWNALVHRIKQLMNDASAASNGR